MTTALAKRKNHINLKSHRESSLLDLSHLSHLCAPNLTFANCDYKELVAYMQKQNLQVDCILTDPPYNISRKNNFTTMGRAGIDLSV